MIIFHDVWSDEQVEFADDEQLWAYAQQHQPWVMLKHPADTDDLIAHLNGHQNLAVWRTDPAVAELPSVAHVMRAAKLLRAGLDHEDPRWRAAMVLHEDHPEAAALVAAGVEPTEANLDALRGLLAAGELAKGEAQIVEDEQPPAGDVLPGAPAAEETAQAVRRAFAAHDVQAIRLGGKHSKGTFLATDPEGGAVLLKPGSGKQSPALGAAQEPASQAEREAAYWHALEVLGLAQFAPRSDLILIGGREYDAQQWLGRGWDPLATTDEQVAGGILRPMRVLGHLHMLAAADAILGNADRHGKNVLVNADAEDRPKMQLIDHGSALAGADFAPHRDPNAFVPAYLRFGIAGWGQLSAEQRYDALPRLGTHLETKLAAWLEAIDGAELEAVLMQYGVDPRPALARLHALRAASEHGAAEAVVRFWTLGLDT